MVLLGLGRVKVTFLKVALLEPDTNVLVQELIDDSQLLLVRCMSVKALTTVCSCILGSRPLILLFFLLLALIAASTSSPTAATATSALTTASTVLATTSSVLAATTTASTPTAISELRMLVHVLLREIVGEIDTFSVLKFLLLFVFFVIFVVLASLFVRGGSLFFFIVDAEAEQCVSIHLSLHTLFRVNDIEMGLKLVFSLERHIALLLALLVWADEVRAGKMHLKPLIAIVEHIAIFLTAQMTRQVHAIQMLLEQIGIKEVFFAKVTPWMRQDFGSTVTGWITMLNMVA